MVAIVNELPAHVSTCVGRYHSPNSMCAYFSKLSLFMIQQTALQTQIFKVEAVSLTVI